VGWSGAALLSLAEAKQKGQLSAEAFAEKKAALLQPQAPSLGNATAAVGGADVQGGDSGDQVAAYTWEQLAKHASASDCWVAVHGEVYDFTCFFAKEPVSHRIGAPLLVHAARAYLGVALAVVRATSAMYTPATKNCCLFAAATARRPSTQQVTAR